MPASSTDPDYPDLGGLLAILFSSLLDAEPWTAFLSTLRKAADASYATVIITPRTADRPGLILTPGADPHVDAEYATRLFAVDPFTGLPEGRVSHFRDFAQYVEAHADEWKAAGKRVAMYCTGGIRCEKTSGWMADLGLAGFELDGGILNYLRAMPDAEKDWQGECFVFDNRVALDTRLQETATTLEDLHAGRPDEAWRLQRGHRLSAVDEEPCVPNGPGPAPAAAVG